MRVARRRLRQLAASPVGASQTDVRLMAQELLARGEAVRVVINDSDQNIVLDLREGYVVVAGAADDVPWRIVVRDGKIEK